MRTQARERRDLGIGAPLRPNKVDSWRLEQMYDDEVCALVGGVMQPTRQLLGWLLLGPTAAWLQRARVRMLQ